MWFMLEGLLFNPNEAVTSRIDYQQTINECCQWFLCIFENI